MMIKYLTVFIVLFFVADVFAQDKVNEGTVSFLTSSSIYVRFNNTDNISIGDTLTVNVDNSLKACLVVTQKSSTSCVCNKIEECSITKGSAVYHRKKVELVVIPDNEIEETIVESVNNIDSDTIQILSDNGISEGDNPNVYQANYYARISAASYSNLDPEYGDRHRMMWRVAFNANNINNSKLSVESYINYRRNFESQTITSSSQNSILRIYNAAFNYQLDSNSVITVGRKINRRMSSVGAIDGVQLDKSIGNVYAGFVVGFKPDLGDFGFNPNLLQYGLYFAKDISAERTYGSFTMGLLEQRNGSAIDRRYSYFQYNINLNRNLSLFGSAEIDLYENITVSKQFKPKLTNLYLSAGYKFNRNISLNVSFDSRKRIIYYETLRTELERLLDDDEARQGVRVRLNLRPIKMIYMGISYSKRFQNSTQNKSDNINAFVSLPRIPITGGRMSFNYNQNTSNYLISKIYSGRYSRNIFSNKIEADAYYRYVRYDYFNTETMFSQYYAGLGISWNVTRDLSLNIMGEQSEVSGSKRYRINTRLIKRFRSN